MIRSSSSRASVTLLGALLLPLLTLGAACTPSSPPLPPVLPGQPPVAPPPAPPAPSFAAQAPAPPPDPNAFDPGEIKLVLDDARLAGVKAEVEHEAYAKAASLLSAALTTASPSPEDQRAWLFQLGHLRALGGDPSGAAKAYEESAASGWVLAADARLLAAEWLVGVGQFDAALADLAAIPEDARESLRGAGSSYDTVAADAYLGKNDMARASTHFRAYLDGGGDAQAPATARREKHGAPWVNVALRYANALLNHPSHANSEEAVHVARRVLWDVSSGQGYATAIDIEKRAIETLPTKRRKTLERLSAEQQVHKARGLASAGQLREAVLVTDKLVKTSKMEKPSEASCELWLVRAEALVKMHKKKPEAADAYKGAIDHCEGQPRRPEALFAGGKASASAGRNAEARERFALVEKEFPTHRLADDARVRGAIAARDGGDEARFVEMMTSIADTYPEGDVTNDGLFDLAMFHAEKSDWARALPVLDKARTRAPRERAYWAAGRLPYFVARAHIALGAEEKGYAELGEVIRDYPLSYYMTLAYSRLAAHDRGAANRVLGEAFARESAGPFTLKKGAWLEDRANQRAVELLRQGDPKLARVALDKIGFTTRKAPREILWLAAFLFAREGAFTQSHQLFRTPVSTATPQNNELVDWLDHYPTGSWRAAWELAFPRPFLPVVSAACAKQGLSEAWAYGIMREESAFEPHVVSGAKAFGLMQLIVPTAKKMAEPLGLVADEDTLKQPSVNVPLGVHYLTVLKRQFPDNPLLAIPGYNAGAGAPRKWIDNHPDDDFDLWVERIPYEETRNYTKRVIGTMAAYEMLYAADRPHEALSAPLRASPAAGGMVKAAGNAGDKQSALTPDH